MWANTHSHTRTWSQNACTHTRAKQYSFPSEPAALKHLYRLSLSLQTNVYSKAALRPVQWDLLMPTLPTSESTAVTEKRLLLFPAELPVICCHPLTKRCARTVQAGGFQKSSHNAATWGFDSSSGGRGLQIKWQPSECMCLLVFKLCLWAPGLA